MQKYLLFLFVFIVSIFMTVTPVGSTSTARDFLWFHPQNTTVDGLVEIADNVIKKNLLIYIVFLFLKQELNILILPFLMRKQIHQTLTQQL